MSRNFWTVSRDPVVYAEEQGMRSSNSTEPPRQWARRRRGPSKGDRRNAQIFEAAARLFSEKGYAATSLQDLADAVGLQKGSLYHYIDSKEDLLRSIMEYTHTFFMDLVASHSDLNGSAAERLEETLYRHAAFAAEHHLLSAVFYNERATLAPEDAAKVIATRDRYEDLIRGLIKEGVRVGEFAEDLDVKVASLGLLGMVNWIHYWYKPDGPLSRHEIAHALSRQAVQSLRPGT